MSRLHGGDVGSVISSTALLFGGGDAEQKRSFLRSPQHRWINSRSSDRESGKKNSMINREGFPAEADAPETRWRGEGWASRGETNEMEGK